MCRMIKIHSRLWNDAKFATLSDKAKLAYFFLLTHPHQTDLGALRATLPGLAAELGWKQPALRKALLELTHQGLVRHCESAGLVWLPNFLLDNRPESPNVVKSWEAALDVLPECALRHEMLLRVKEYAEAWGDAFRQALPEAFRLAKPFPASAVPPACAVPVVEPEPAAEPQRVPSPEPVSPPEVRELPALLPSILPTLDSASRLDFASSPVPVPASLQTPEFLEAWGRWQAFCDASYVPIRPPTLKTLLQKLSEWGPTDSVRAIQQSIDNDWAGYLARPQPVNGHNGQKRRRGRLTA